MNGLKKLVKIFLNYRLAGTLYLLFETLVARPNKPEKTARELG